jgi:hypothetical protein
VCKNYPDKKVKKKCILEKKKRINAKENY